MQEILKTLVQKNSTKIIFIVLDGLGGLPLNGKTELETAFTPNLDQLAKLSACGMHIPVSYGITPGSGPGHLSIFGYDPLKWQIGRGVLEALGLGIKLTPRDMAIRANYAKMKDGIIIDRRAGRIPTEESRKITERLQKKIQEIDGVEVIFTPGMEHRFAIVLRFPETLSRGSDMINDTDPQKENNPPLSLKPGSPSAEKLIPYVERLIEMITDELKNEEKANYVLLRGFSTVPEIPQFSEIYGLNPVCIAVYPMYRGISALIGMDTVEVMGDIREEIEVLKELYNNSAYDFFFVHIKKVDSYGEDGDFFSKVKKIEEFDRFLPDILTLNPDVLVITGDHSTPAILRSHGWHPVPLLLRSPYVLGGTSAGFGERECLKGELGIIPSVQIMPLVLANAMRLKKFGA